MKRHLWIIRAWFWLAYHTSYHAGNLHFADGLYDRAGSKTPRQAVEDDMRDWY